MDKWIQMGKVDPDDLQIILDECGPLFANDRRFEISGISSKDPDKIKNIRSSRSSFPSPKQTSQTSQVAFFILEDYFQTLGLRFECQYPQIQLIKYVDGDFYAWHNDLTSREGDVRLISMSITLNEEFSNGGLLVRSRTTKEEFYLANEAGAYAIFTSLHEHTALPVTGGERRAITFWFMSNETELQRMQSQLKKQPL